MTANKYKWNQISRVPASEGVYAWYLPLKLSSKDIEIVTQKVISFKDQKKTISAKDAIREFINNKILNFYNEEPYKATLEGALKPKYTGKVYHEATVSDSLVDRLYDEPVRIESVGKVLIETAPNFASPIYIGMASNLQNRLKKHKILIEKYSANNYMVIEKNQLPDEEKRDHNFAMRVVNRGIPETEMFVYIQEIKNGKDIYKDIENLLNRINYPVLGRN